MPKAKKIEKKPAEKTGGRRAVLIITEKPQAAQKIAAALSDGKDEKISDKNKVSYFEFEKNGTKVFVGCAVGHLFGIKQKEKRGSFPNFDVDWTPNYTSKGSEFTKRYFDVLKKLAKNADEFIVATDFDVEGEVIGWNVVRFICGDKELKKTKRMKFSSLTKDELKNAYENLNDEINWGHAFAGETRHYLDWFYGINLSRGLMKALSKTGKFRILSIGRVQGPALKIIVDREIEIKDFKSEPFWQVFLRVRDIKKQEAEVKFPKDIFNESELLKFQHLKDKKGFAKTTIKEEQISQPIPFDLTTLQTESYKFFRYTPTQTLQIAQKLYLDGMISYPRTSSQQYPEAIGYDKILKQLKKYTQLVKYAVNKKPTEGKKTDPAHPAIYPTGETGKMNENDKKIYDLIVRRFISCFCEPAIVDNKTIEVEVSGLKFYAKGVKIKEKNWMNVYKSSLKESEVPTINGEVDVMEIRIEEKQTQPPNRYSPASLVKELEKRGLGTKATRASIVETLYQRGYIKEKSIEATSLGMRMIETLKKYSPIIIDEDLTKHMEEEMEEMQVEKSRKNLEKKEEEIKDNSKKSIIKIAEDMIKNEDKIGNSLAEANSELIEQQKQDNTLNKCPVCKKGNLRIMYGKRFKRYFVSCDAYPECKTIFSLPPNGSMKPAKIKDEASGEEKLELCQECGFPMIVALRKGRRPWKFCFNPKCKTNEEWQKKKEEYAKEKKEEAGKEEKEEEESSE